MTNCVHIQTQLLPSMQGGLKQGIGVKTHRSGGLHGSPLVQLGLQNASPVGSNIKQSSSRPQLIYVHGSREVYEQM